MVPYKIKAWEQTVPRQNLPKTKAKQSKTPNQTQTNKKNLNETYPSQYSGKASLCTYIAR